MKDNAVIRLKATRLVQVLNEHPHEVRLGALNAASKILKMNAIPITYDAIQRLSSNIDRKRKRRHKRTPEISIRDVSLIDMVETGNMVAAEQILSACDGTRDTAFPRSSLFQMKNGFNVLHMAICNDRPQMLSYILVHAKANDCLQDLIETNTTSGWTPLSLACTKQHSSVEMVKQLLDVNVDVFTRSPITSAIRYGNPKHASLIIKYVREKKEKECLHRLLYENATLYTATLHGEQAVVQDIISAHNYMIRDKTIRSRFLNASRGLHAACTSTAKSCASRILLTNGADPTLRDPKTGLVPLTMAITNGKTHIVWQLTDGLRLWPTYTPGLETKILMTTDVRLNNPLHCAVISGHTQICYAIILFAKRTLTTSEFEAFLNCKNEDGDTPLILASIYQWHHIINIFDDEPLVNFKIPNTWGYTPHRILLMRLQPQCQIEITDQSSSRFSIKFITPFL